MIIPIVLHRIVEFDCVDFEDITVKSLDQIFDKDSEKYITVDDIDKSKIESKERYYFISFDDGYLSDYDIVFPKLKKLNIKATFFVNIDNIGRPGYVDWEMLKDMKNSKMSIGSHGYSHVNMKLLNEAEVKYSLVESRQCLKRILLDDIDIFSFPYGKYSPNLIGLVKSASYKYCFSSRHGIIDGYTDIYPRNSINKTMGYADIERIMNLKLYTRFIWWFEDLIKNIIKSLFGDKVYVAIRKFAASSVRDV